MNPSGDSFTSSAKRNAWNDDPSKQSTQIDTLLVAGSLLELSHYTLYTQVGSIRVYPIITCNSG